MGNDDLRGVFASLLEEKNTVDKIIESSDDKNSRIIKYLYEIEESLVHCDYKPRMVIRKYMDGCSIDKIYHMFDYDGDTIRRFIKNYFWENKDWLSGIFECCDHITVADVLIRFNTEFGYTLLHSLVKELEMKRNDFNHYKYIQSTINDALKCLSTILSEVEAKYSEKMASALILYLDGFTKEVSCEKKGITVSDFDEMLADIFNDKELFFSELFRFIFDYNITIVTKL